MAVVYASRAERDLYEQEDEDDNTPQQRKPLSKQRRIEIIESLEFENSQQELIDAIEAAHGIKEKNT